MVLWYAFTFLFSYILFICSRTNVPCVITSSRDKVICVLTCSLANVSCVLICVRTYAICVLFAITYQRALRAFELTYQRALSFHLPSVLMHSRISVACKIMCLGATMPWVSCLIRLAWIRDHLPTCFTPLVSSFDVIFFTFTAIAVEVVHTVGNV